MAKVELWTDGSCNNHTHNSGGYGIVLVPEGSESGTNLRQWCGGSYMNTTSARMELLAMVKGLEKCNVGDEITLFSDNQYAVFAISKGWIFKWEKQNFRARKNCDLLKQLLAQYKRLQGKVTLEWVRGHNGTVFNELADQLAARGAVRPQKIKDMRYT